MNIIFRAKNSNPVNYKTNSPQAENTSGVFGVSSNAQEVLNKTNEYACGIQMANAIIEPENRKENLGKAAKNALLMPVMSTTPVSTIYTLKELQNGNISKQDAVKIVAYNSIAQALD